MTKARSIAEAKRAKRAQSAAERLCNDSKNRVNRTGRGSVGAQPRPLDIANLSGGRTHAPRRDLRRIVAIQQGAIVMIGARRMRMRNLDCRYEPKGRIGDACVYCGVESDSYDHVPPLSHVDISQNAGINVDAWNLRKVPACKECNSTLNDKIILTLKERRFFLYKAYKKKHAKFLRMPKWDEDELEDLHPDFADDIRRSSKYAEWIKARMSRLRRLA